MTTERDIIKIEPSQKPRNGFFIDDALADDPSPIQENYHNAEEKQHKLILATIDTVLTVTARLQVEQNTHWRFQDFYNSGMINNATAGNKDDFPEKYEETRKKFNAIMNDPSLTTAGKVSKLQQTGIFVTSETLMQNSTGIVLEDRTTMITAANNICSGYARIEESGIKTPETAVSKSLSRRGGENIKDTYRVSIALDQPEYAQHVNTYLSENYSESGFDADNDWKMRDTGVLTNQTNIEIDGISAEIALTSPHLFEAGKASHNLYKLLRDMRAIKNPDDLSDTETDLLINRFNKLFEGLNKETPEGFTGYIAWPAYVHKKVMNEDGSPQLDENGQPVLERDIEAERDLFRGNNLERRIQELRRAHLAIVVTRVLQSQNSWQELWCGKAIEFNQQAIEKFKEANPDCETVPGRMRTSEIEMAAAQQYGLDIEILNEIPKYRELDLARRNGIIAQRNGILQHERARLKQSHQPTPRLSDFSDGDITGLA